MIGSALEKILIISSGAALGANARYWIGDWVAQKWGSSFPAGTLIINLTGSFLLGFFMAIVSERLMLDPRWRILIAIGFLGSYTTFSTYTYESFNLIFKGEWLPGLLNLLGSSVLGLIAAAIGIYLGKSI